MADWTSEDAGYKLSMNVLKALGGDTSASYENTEEVWGAINDIYDIDNTFNVVPIEETVTSNKTLEYNITDEIDGYGPVRISIDVKEESKTVIPNGFQFTGGDLSLVEWDKYDWNGVYIMDNFFEGCTSSDPEWIRGFLDNYDGEIWSGYSMFGDMKNIIDVDFKGKYFSNTVEMNSMFNGCTSLQTVSGLDTSKVTSMNYMFNGCTSLQTVSGLDTSKVTDMGAMFRQCKQLRSVPVLDFSSAVHVGYMFDIYESIGDTKPPHYINELYIKGDPSNITGYTQWLHTFGKTEGSQIISDEDKKGTIYYDSRYDYSKLLGYRLEGKSYWRCVPYDYTIDR